MKTFKDNAGRTWSLQVDVATVKRAKGLLNINLMEAVGGDLLQRLLNDPILLCDLVYVICQPEAEKRGISDVDFGQAMGGDALDAATEALLLELVDFFPKGKRQVLTRALAMVNQTMDRAVKRVMEMMDSPEFQAKIDATLNAPIDLSSSSPLKPE